MTYIQPRLRQRLRGFGATMLIFLFVAGTPLLLVFIGAAPWVGNLGHLRQLLTSPDDGSFALIMFATAAWIAWAVVTLSVVVEATATVRGLPAPSLPGLGVLQRAAGQLVATAALLFVATPSAFAAFPTPAYAASAPVVETPESAAPAASLVPAEPSFVHDPAEPVIPTATETAQEKAPQNYLVKRGDSLWKIADRMLGDGARYTELVDLNRELLNGRPDFIVPGSVLKVPSEVAETAPDRGSAEYTVKHGDTLSEISEATRGTAARYPELFEASRSAVQPDGASLTDPDLIRPGWQITVPAPPRHKADMPSEIPPPADHEGSIEASPAEPPQTPYSASAASADGEPDDSEASSHAWLLPGLTGAGAVLAALVFLALRANRNTQLRYRRPGQTVSAPPSRLRPVEKTAFVSGAPLTADIARLDQALRELASIYTASGRALPALATVTLADGTATLHLAAATELPEPWSGDGTEWSVRLGTAPPDRNDAIPPYPLLVSVGQDEAGGLYLVNLEHLGVASLTGDPTMATALARHIAAELALNPWSVLVDVTVVGLGEELSVLDPLRLHHFTTGGDVIASITRTLISEQAAGWNDPDPFRVVITAGEGVEELAALLATPATRLGAAVVSLTTPIAPATVIDVDHDGRLRAPSLGLELRAAGLTSDEATACAAIVDLTRESEPERVAPIRQVADGWRALADQAGALREALTDVRDEGRAGSGSLLPDSAQTYAEVAATTPADVETLAPIVTEQVRRTVEEADPTLDEDLAEWFDPEVKRPRLILLGPVKARAFGAVAPAITKRKPYFVEILAFLALHPEGVTGSTVAEAFGVAASRARTDLGSLREWLGDNARTGEPHLPAANQSPAYRETGVKTYQVQDVLVDLDLFRRLRARGEARGSEGIADLRMAMTLVAGQPFTLLRERGWSWLLDGERLHETIGCSIVDTAHILVLDSLAKGDLRFAREAAELACKAAPYDDICRLDLVKVAEVEGREGEADTMLAEEVFDRSDDYLPPIDLPQRTSDVVRRQRWGNAKRPGTA